MDVTIRVDFENKRDARSCFERLDATGISKSPWVLVAEPDIDDAGIYYVLVRVRSAEMAQQAIRAIWS